MGILFVIPLTVIPLIAYTVVGFIFGQDVWSTGLFELTMISGQSWPFTLGDLMIVGGLICLFFEVLRSTSSSQRTIVNHTISTIILIVYLIEFLLVGIAANSVFFILMVMSLFDVIAGFSITIKTASRDLNLGRTLDAPQ